MNLNVEEILKKYELESGKHASLEEGACVMELVSFIANEPWSDHPKCACPALTSFAISFNDRVDAETRQRLKPLIPKLLNSVNPEKKKLRSEFLVLQAITVFLPLYTEALGLEEITTRLRGFNSGEWLEARDYINSVKPEIRRRAAAAAAAAGWEAAAAGKTKHWQDTREKIIAAALKALSDACDL